MPQIVTTYGLILIFLIGVVTVSEAQSYRQDSLQIKAYTIIKYENNKAIDIKLQEVLCDYCSEAQKKAIGDEALRRTFSDRYNNKNRIKNGKKKLAIFIRVAKADLAAIVDESNSEN